MATFNFSSTTYLGEENEYTLEKPEDFLETYQVEGWKKIFNKKAQVAMFQKDGDTLVIQKA